MDHVGRSRCHYLLGYLLPRPPKPTLFPYTTLFRSHLQREGDKMANNQPWLSNGGVEVLTRLAEHPFWKKRAEWKRSEEHTSELQSLTNLVCRLLLEKKNESY